jgi:hypothetical protein
MTGHPSSTVIPGLVPGIHALFARRLQDVDGRNKCGHDDSMIFGDLR